MWVSPSGKNSDHENTKAGKHEGCMIDLGSVTVPRVMSFGKCPFDQEWAEMEHVDPCSELMHILRGRVEVRTREYSIVGREGDTIFTPAGTPHRDVFATESAFEVYLVRFSVFRELVPETNNLTP